MTSSQCSGSSNGPMKTALHIEDLKKFAKPCTFRVEDKTAIVNTFPVKPTTKAHSQIDPDIIPREWSLAVPLHKSLDLSLLTHRDPFAAHCCPQGVSTDPTGRHRLPQFMILVFFNTHYWRKSVIYLRTSNDSSLLFWKKEPAYWDGASIILKVFTGSIDLSKWPAVTRFTFLLEAVRSYTHTYEYFTPLQPSSRVANLRHAKAFSVARLKKHALSEKNLKTKTIKTVRTLAEAKLVVSCDVTSPAGFTTGIQLSECTLRLHDAGRKFDMNVNDNECSTSLNTLTFGPLDSKNLMVSQYLSWPTDTRTRGANNTEPPQGTPSDKIKVDVSLQMQVTFLIEVKG
ncbi:hypothetical protein G5I_13439 [Acromyrmex echinatior]|uniref:Uncharacterized protein n=1 Tax=Acromyrmex echinatior TaxID=103372 RepID=F4X516_ACREC|nr:hypothetical protein G5I_13439 [Acromyrmex echinatior]